MNWFSRVLKSVFQILPDFSTKDRSFSPSVWLSQLRLWILDLLISSSGLFHLFQLLLSGDICFKSHHKFPNLVRLYVSTATPNPPYQCPQQTSSPLGGVTFLFLPCLSLTNIIFPIISAFKKTTQWAVGMSPKYSCYNLSSPLSYNLLSPWNQSVLWKLLECLHWICQ